MTSKATPAPPASGPKSPASDLLTRQAWLSNQREELLAPASALLELSSFVVREAEERGHEEFLRDQRQIRVSAERLLNMIHQVLDPATLMAGKEELNRRVGHDLRTPLTEILGLCEIWLDEAGDKLLEGFVGELQRLRELSKELLTSLDQIVGFGKIASDPDIDLDHVASGQVQAIRDLVDRLPPLQEEQKSGPRPTGAILVVDDNAINRDVLVRRLSHDGHHVVAAANGKQALALVRTQHVDLILLDIIMPEMNGVEVLIQLKSDTRLRHIPVIMISAFHELESVVRCIEIGAEDYMPKPFSPVLLRARIDASLEKKRLRDREVKHLEALDRERRCVNDLLHVILPGEIVRELKATTKVQPRRYENVAVLFADIVGFTNFCDSNGPEAVIAPLQALVEACEDIALRQGVEKIKTIGDAFMGAAGLLRPSDNPVLCCLRSGLDMIAACQTLGTGWNLRVGVHVGPVVAGVIGKRQYLFDLWGDTVNTAARMESYGVPGSVTLSAAAWDAVAPYCRGERRGNLSIKGKGTMEMVRFVEFVDG